MKTTTWHVLGCLVLSTGLSGLAWAGPKSKLAREAAEHVMARFGKETAQEGVETLTRKIEGLALRHGDEVFVAVRRFGPRTFRLVEEAGEHGDVVIQLLARRGDDAVWVVARRNRLALFVRFGDDAADAMVKHGEVAEPILESYGKPAASALQKVSPQNGRRIAMLSGDSDLDCAGRGEELLRVVGDRGDRAADWIWQNRQALRDARVLAAFLANPESFLANNSAVPSAGAEAPGTPSARHPDNQASRLSATAVWAGGMLLVVAAAGLLVWRGTGRWRRVFQGK